MEVYFICFSFLKKSGSGSVFEIFTRRLSVCIIFEWMKHIMLIECRGHRVVSFSSFSSPRLRMEYFIIHVEFLDVLCTKTWHDSLVSDDIGVGVLKNDDFRVQSICVYIFIQRDMISYLSIWPFLPLLFYVLSSYIFTVYTYWTYGFVKWQRNGT